MLSEKEQQRILQALKQKSFLMTCGRCHGNSFAALGYAFQTLTTTVADANVIGGKGIKVAVVGCNSCGLIGHHALQVIGLE